MPLSTADLEQLLSLALAALRANATNGAPVPPEMAAAAAAVAQQVAAPAHQVDELQPPAAVDAPGQPAEPTLAEWLDVHERQLGERGYKAQTLKNRRACIGHVRRLWGDRPIKAVKPHEIASVLRKFDPKHSSSAVRVLSELRDAYAEAVMNGWAETNPAIHVKLPAHKVMRARLKWEVWQAMRQLAQTGPQRWVESMLLLALVTGQRRADLAKMRFTDIVVDDEGQQCLRIEQQKQAGKGYGARVEIPLTLYMECIGMTVGDVIEHCRTTAKPGATLIRKAGGGAIEESSLSARFHECILAVLGPTAHGPYEWPSLHEVRSLSARMYVAQGLTRETVQTLLGHKHAEMTDLYTDDRGLSRDQWKRVKVPSATPARLAAEPASKPA